MIESGIRAVLLDIEGTTSSVQFVYEVLFPFARRELTDFLRRRWGDADVTHACAMMPGNNSTQEGVAAEAIRLMDGDVKATGLKELQGLIWQEGYAAGHLKSHVYADVPPALRCWKEQGLDLRIFSSGSVAAQKVFFAHTDAGDLLPFFQGHYDTTTGPKREAESYRRIAADMKLPTSAILFLSDIVQELDAAAEAGMRTGLVVRPGNAPVTAGQVHPVVTDFGQIDL